MYNPIYIVRHVPHMSERVNCVQTLKQAIPDLVVIEDLEQKPMETFIKAITFDNERPLITLEDDIELCDDFCDIVTKRVREAPYSVINFFGSCRSKRSHSKYQKGRYFKWTQCVYFPPGYGEMIADYLPTWREVTGPKLLAKFASYTPYTVDTLYDHMVAAWLDSRGEDYYISLPALVQHLPVKSVTHSGLPTTRQNQTFKKVVV